MSHQTQEHILDTNSVGVERYRVVIFNNPWNTMDEVMYVLMRATGCDAEEAYMEMWEAHHFGKANVHFDSEAECLRVATIISAVGVETEVKEEWGE